MPLAIHFARRCLLGGSPIPHWLQKSLLRLRVLQTLSVRTLPTMKRHWFSATMAGSVRQFLPQNKIWPNSHQQWESELGQHRQPGPHKVVKGWLEARDYGNSPPSFAIVSPRLTFCWSWKDALWESTVSTAFQMSLSNGVRTHGNWLRPAGWGHVEGFEIHEWIIKAWPNADTHPAVGEALVDTKAAGRKSFFVLLCGHGHCGSEGRIKQKVAPKDLFRISADRIGFGDATAIH